MRALIAEGDKENDKYFKKDYVNWYGDGTI
jgi:hypothetical protein